MIEHVTKFIGCSKKKETTKEKVARETNIKSVQNPTSNVLAV